MSKEQKRKHYFSQKFNKKQRYSAVQSGLKGFLCSCNNREKECIRETYNLLNKYADGLCEKKEDNPSKEQIEVEVEQELQEELKQIKNSGEKRFHLLDSGAKNFLFIKTSEDPLLLANNIVKDIAASGKQQTRYLLRLIPVQITCKAYVDDIRLAIKPLIEQNFSEKPKSFSIIFNHRNNNSLSKDEVIKNIAEMVEIGEIKHTVNLNEPDISIVIEIIRSFAFLAIIPEYVKYKKFNLHSICENNQSQIDNNKLQNENN